MEYKNLDTKVSRAIYRWIGGGQLLPRHDKQDFAGMGTDSYQAAARDRRVQTALTSSTMQERIYMCVSPRDLLTARQLSAGQRT